MSELDKPDLLPTEFPAVGKICLLEDVGSDCVLVGFVFSITLELVRVFELEVTVVDKDCEDACLVTAGLGFRILPKMFPRPLQNTPPSDVCITIIVITSTIAIFT